MPLLIRPVKMNKSIYVRVPNDIAHIIGLDNQVEVSFSFEDIGNELRLIYSMNKSTNEHQPDNNPMVPAKPMIGSGPSRQGLGTHERRSENGTKIETQELPRE
ncbi:MAG: hypothetical protein ABSF63_09290 [Candidatus Bathyarchaeia archaeon]|jgi:hypothetical protein